VKNKQRLFFKYLYNRILVNYTLQRIHPTLWRGRELNCKKQPIDKKYLIHKLEKELAKV